MARRNRTHSSKRTKRSTFIRWFYERLFDNGARLLTNWVSDEKTILIRLKKEEKFLKQIKIMHAARLIGFQHERASTLLTHISIMIGLVGILAGFGIKLSIIFRAFAAFETCLYLIIALFLIRCLREFGLDESYSSANEYKIHIMNELAFRFALVRLSNFGAIVVTTFFILASAVELIF
jgi:hypothetical protein